MVVQKYGRTNENTPAKWNAEYTDFNAPLDGTQNDGPGAPLTRGNGVSETTSKADVLAAPPVAPTGEPMDEDAGSPQLNGDSKDKKRKKHEGETPEERAERKRRKKEKKDKKEKRKSGASKADSDDSD